jgi:hypothetical protein
MSLSTRLLALLFDGAEINSLNPPERGGHAPPSRRRKDPSIGSSKIDGLPAIPRECTSKWLERSPFSLKQLWGNGGAFSLNDAPAVANPKVANRPDIFSSEWTHEEHLGCPGADPSDLGKDVNHVAVTHSAELADSEASFGDSRGEIQQGRFLGARDATCPHHSGWGSEERLCRHRTS